MNERSAWVWLAVATIILLGGIIVTDRPKSTNSTDNANENAAILHLREDDWRQGPSDAPLTLVEYGDFQCPACADYAPIIDGLALRFPTELQIVFRHFPLAQHRQALIAARSAEAAGLQGKFWQMVDLLYDRQSQWAEKSEAADIMLRYAQELGLDEALFEHDRDSSDVSTHINDDLTDTRVLGLSSTPTFFLDDELIENPQNLDLFAELIQRKIAERNNNE